MMGTPIETIFFKTIILLRSTPPKVVGDLHAGLLMNLHGVVKAAGMDDDPQRNSARTSKSVWGSFTTPCKCVEVVLGLSDRIDVGCLEHKVESEIFLKEKNF